MLRKQAVITGEGKVEVRQLELPELAKNEVRIKTQASLISPGTEMSAVRRFREKPEPDAKPLLFGYACAGEIIETNGDCGGLKPGMRVAAMGGGSAQHADYVNVPKNMVVPLPDEVDYEDAVYACLGATSLQAVRRATPQLSDYGVVLGLGIVGNLAMQLCRLSGARMTGWEGLPGRRDIAAACGLTNISAPGDTALEVAKNYTAPYGMDFAIFAFGGNADNALIQVRQIMKLSPDGHAMGRIVLVGGCSVEVNGGATNGNLDILISSRTGPGYHDPQWEHGADYPNAFVTHNTRRNLYEIINLIAEKRLIVKPMTTHRMPLEEVEKATELLINSPDKALGIVLQMSH
ncbi:MAG: hypothetical protein PHO45_05695 [Victivallaceae bacterium]|nr:hypothetical protein [Victivallaceae bacterium]